MILNKEGLYLNPNSQMFILWMMVILKWNSLMKALEERSKRLSVLTEKKSSTRNTHLYLRIGPMNHGKYVLKMMASENMA